MSEISRQLKLEVLPVDAEEKDVTITISEPNVVACEKIVDSDTDYKFSAIHPGKAIIITRATDGSLVSNKLEVSVTSKQKLNATIDNLGYTYYRDTHEVDRISFDAFSFYGDNRNWKTVFHQTGNLYIFNDPVLKSFGPNTSIYKWCKSEEYNLPQSFTLLYTVRSGETEENWIEKDNKFLDECITDEIKSYLNGLNVQYLGSQVSFVNDENVSISYQTILHIGTGTILDN